MTSGPAVWLSILVLISSCTVLCSAFRYGDPIPMLKRSQYKGYRTSWSEMVHRDAPRFGIDKTVKLHALQDARQYSTDEEFKLSFSFANERFLIPWISVTDGKANYLNYISFTFTYSGALITGVKFTTEYHEESKIAGEKPDHIYIRYHWHEEVVADSVSGVSFVLLTSTAVCWLCGVLAMFGWDTYVAPRAGAGAIKR